MSKTQIYSFGIHIPRGEMLMRGEDGLVRKITLSEDFIKNLGLEGVGLQYLASYALGQADVSVTQSTAIDRINESIAKLYHSVGDFNELTNQVDWEIDGSITTLNYEELESYAGSDLSGFKKYHIFFNINTTNEDQLELIPGQHYPTHEFHH